MVSRYVSRAGPKTLGVSVGVKAVVWAKTSSPPPSVPPDYAMGASASNCESGIRNYVYSLDTVVNPSTYKTLDKPGYWGMHTIRCFWVVQQRLFGTHNFLKTLLPPAPNADGSLPPNYFYRPQTFNSLTGHANPLVPKHGNMSLMQLVLDGMELQPCAPGFFDARDARDAIIQTDEILTGVENA